MFIKNRSSCVVVQEKELSLLEDISQLQEIVSGLYQLTRDPNMLSAGTEQAIVDMKDGAASVDMQSILSGHSGRVCMLYWSQYALSLFICHCHLCAAIELLLPVCVVERHTQLKEGIDDFTHAIIQ